jgi:hypothetical protein
MKQITEDCVSEEVAKLLQMKGFDEPCDSYYEWFESRVTLYKGYMPEFYHGRYKPVSDMLHLKRPTHQMTLKWLREVHELHIDVFIGSDESHDADGVMVDEWHFWTYYITNTSGDMIYDAYNEVDVIEHQTHEEAVEAALNYVLKNLI